jgi:hypothetical protein
MTFYTPTIWRVDEDGGPTPVEVAQEAGESPATSLGRTIEGPSLNYLNSRGIPGVAINDPYVDDLLYAYEERFIFGPKTDRKILEIGDKT